MRHLFFAICALVFLAPLQAQSDAAKTYRYSVDLNSVKDDQLSITLQVPETGAKSLKFWLPRMVPGTYSVYDFSRFVTSLEAFDEKGKKVKFKRSKDGMYWEFKQAAKLKKIVYTVEDTWDTKQPNTIFEPAGTNITDDKSVFVFNNHGIFGYFEGFDRLPYELTIDRPAKLFGGTSLIRKGGDADTDIFIAEHYHEVVDAPIMFAPADTAMLKVGNTNVLIHTYSPTGRVKSKDLQKDIEPILRAQIDYLGGSLPVDRYAFLIFLNKEGQFYKSGAAGALEHSYSSFYCLFEGETSAIGQMVRDVAAHEFFHIITPLFIHSEEIHYFDFANPKMSEHLWLYEGVTEYSAQHVQVKQGLQTVPQFMSTMSQKLRASKMYKDDVSATVTSKGALDTYKSQYSNVYQKGALIGMCLDLKLRILSKGAYGIQDLLRDLSKKYGIKQPFKDAELFDEIANTSKQPAIKQFLLDHVAGITPLPYDQLLREVGYSYLEEGEVSELSKFGITDLQRGFDFDKEQKRMRIKASKHIDKFGKDVLGWQEGDLLVKWNGNALDDVMAINTVLGTHEGTAKEGDLLTVDILRKDASGEYKPLTLSAKLAPITSRKKHVFIPLTSTTAEQIALRKAWLGQ